MSAFGASAGAPTSARGTYSRYGRSSKRPFWNAPSPERLSAATSPATLPGASATSASVVSASAKAARGRISARTAPRRKQDRAALHVPDAERREPHVGEEVRR